MLRFLILIPVIVFGFLIQEEKPAPKNDTEKRIEKIREYVNDAGQLYKARDYQASANKISAAQKLLTRAANNGSEEYREQLQKEHGRIAKAHELLTAKGIELTALEELPEQLGTAEATQDKKTETAEDEKGADSGMIADPDDTGVDDETRQVSFKDDVAPLLVQHCGKCHVRSSKGKFNMGTFEKLMAAAEGEAVVPGEPANSLIVTLVESGDMPPRGKVPQADLDLVKSWIESGAEFDGDDKTATIGGERRGR